MSVRMAGPVIVEELEGRRLLAAVGGAMAWDLQTPIQGELSQKGEVDYYRFNAQVGQVLLGSFDHQLSQFVAPQALLWSHVLRRGEDCGIRLRPGHGTLFVAALVRLIR